MWYAVKKTTFGRLVRANDPKASEPLRVFLCGTRPFTVTEVRELDQHAPFGALEFDSKADALEAAKLISTPGRREAVQVAPCGNGCGPLDWVDDNYHCPKCGDEWSFEVIRGYPIQD